MSTMMRERSADELKALPDSAFADPESRSYPIEDEEDLLPLFNE